MNSAFKFFVTIFASLIVLATTAVLCIYLARPYYFIEHPTVINVNAFRIDAEINRQVKEALGGLESRMALPPQSQVRNRDER